MNYDYSKNRPKTILGMKWGVRRYLTPEEREYVELMREKVNIDFESNIFKKVYRMIKWKKKYKKFKKEFKGF